MQLLASLPRKREKELKNKKPENKEGVVVEVVEGRNERDQTQDLS
jgi:hypothetical protein